MGYLNNLYKIFKGTVAGDKTGTPARTAAQGINDNMDAIDNALAAIDTASEKKVNKVPNLDAVNDTTYPTSKAVKDYSDGKEIAANNFTSSQLGSYQAKSEKGIANGYAGLDANALVPAVNLPAFVDEILEGQYIDATTFNDDAPTPAPYTPASGKLYVDKVAVPPKIYRWGGSVYAEIVGSPGSTDVVAEGTTNLYFSGARVLATVLAGLDTLTALAVNSGDTILVGIGKLQAQFNTISTSIGNKLDKGTYTGNAGDLKSLIDAKETPLGAQAKADTAETNAKAYADTLLKETIAGRYATYAAMIADQVNQVSKGVYAVADASGFSTVDAGYADFEYLGTTLGTEADYRKLSEEESMDAAAGAVMSDAEVKTAYENNADTNAFTDALLAKINSITAIFTTALKSSYDAAATWVTTNGANVVAHINAAHAPADAQKNSNITKAEIEAILIGEIASHTHAGGGGAVIEDVIVDGETLKGASQNAIFDALALKATVADAKFEVLSHALSSPTADLAAGDADSFHAPFNFTLNSYYIAVNDAPTGSSLVVDVKKNTVSVTSTKASIDATEFTSLTGIAPVLTTTSFLKGDKITPNIFQVGSINTGKSLKIYLTVTRT